MNLRARLSDKLSDIGRTPVTITDPLINDPKRIQIAILQIGDGKYRTVICNGEVLVWLK